MNSDTIISVFDELFAARYRTRLVGGYAEPFYRAPTLRKTGQIQFRQDFAASALHEVAHWCIAGSLRRANDDFGYWYKPERDAHAQLLFEQSESAPQALEWMFCVAAGIPFRVSTDNFEHGDRDHLRQCVHQAVLERLRSPLPTRAAKFAEALARQGCNTYYCHSHYQLPPQ